MLVRRCAAVGAIVASLSATVAAGGMNVTAVWVPAPIDVAECPSLDGYRSADLYLGFDVAPGNPAVTSAPGTGLAIVGGTFYQDETGINGPRPDEWYEVFPCARWDSYLTVGGAAPFFSPTYPEPDEADWGSELVAEWIGAPGETVEVVVDPSTFGDERFYVRIARFTATPGAASIAGELGVVYVPNAGMAIQDSVVVPNCPVCWFSQDLTGDGIVNAADLAALIAAWGACAGACPADFNADGVVGPEDLAELIAAWG